MNHNGKRIVVVDGVRTPFLKAGSVAREVPAYELGRQAVVALLNKLNLKPNVVDEVVIGCVGNPPEAANEARVIALRAGLDQSTPARTVSAVVWAAPATEPSASPAATIRSAK